jgi:hypothetical protein
MSDTSQSTSQTITRSKPPALPATTADMLGQRKTELRRTLNDHVETLHLRLYENADYQRLLDAVYDEDAVEGSLAADNILAAQMIRDTAAAGNADLYVAEKKLATISKALSVVLRRYGMSRKERARMINGESVEANGE